MCGDQNLERRWLIDLHPYNYFVLSRARRGGRLRRACLARGGSLAATLAMARGKANGTQLAQSRRLKEESSEEYVSAALPARQQPLVLGVRSAGVWCVVVLRLHAEGPCLLTLSRGGRGRGASGLGGSSGERITSPTHLAPVPSLLTERVGGGGRGEGGSHQGRDR